MRARGEGSRARRALRSVAALLLTALLFTALLPRAAHAVPASELVARSRTAAAREDWNTAARALEELVAAGIDSSDVLYDLGTVYVRAGRYGEAIYRLEQVARRSPFALDAQQNLRAARLRLAHRDAARSGRAVVETATPFATWYAELLPLDWAVVLTLVCEALALACLWVYWRRRGHAAETVRVASAVGMILLTAAAALSAGIVVARTRVPPAGIVLRDGLRLLHAPAADAIAEAPVREGERVELLAQQGTFTRVRTPEGAAGWLATRDVGALAE